MSILIRPYQPSDREFVLGLVSRFSEFELPEWRLPEEIDRTNRATLEQVLQQSAPGSVIFVAEDGNGLLAGFIHLQAETDYFNNSKYGYISDLAVDRAFEGKGMGRALLATAEDWAREKGYQLLALYVFASNWHARQVYERYGFKPEVVKYVKSVQLTGSE
jgi:ribosomal protein S18 acetylase RimI-like enzyme